jgi:hypothetical protein
MDPEKLQRALVARARRKKATRLEERPVLSLSERIFLRVTDFIEQKRSNLFQKSLNPKEYSARNLLGEFNKILNKLERDVEKGKEPNRRLVSTVVTLVPMIGSIPLVHLSLEPQVKDSFARLTALTNKMEGHTAMMLQSVLCILSLVSSAAVPDLASWAQEGETQI